MLMMKSLLPLILVLATCWASDPIFDEVLPQVIKEVLDSYRLPENVIPSAYNIKLEPIFESSEKDKNFTFEGTSEITLEIKNTNTITFHAKGLKFLEDKTKLTYEVKNVITTAKLKSFSIDVQKDFVILTFEENINTKNAKLFLAYTGELNDELRGFYRSSYQKEGKKMWLATTHFEPVSARQAFPCWDEPQFKAVFTIAIVVPQVNDYKAISNMPVEKTEKAKVTFRKTPKMSTYLVAFVVSNFTALENEQKNFRVWAKPTVENSSKTFALNYGLKVLEALKNFTSIDYYGKEQGMLKMDQIAIPDFGAGAMENWGLVTYREPALLYIENKTTTESKQAIATVIAHEFAHQWFGNLVTCQWWDYIWLNEGFATFFQYYISDIVTPELPNIKESWRLMEQFVIQNVQALSFVVDASSKTRALNPKISVQTPTQIHSLFDSIAYKKGASILHMMHGFLSKDVFKEGLSKYLKDYQGKSVTPSNFFDSVQKSDKNKLEEYLPKNVTLEAVMNTWVNEPGYPVITVTWNKTLPGVVNITQERFFLVKPTKVDKTEWYIPINYVMEESPETVMPENKQSRWMIPGTSTSFNQLNDTKWILFNKDQTGYYRVNYDETNWQNLASYLNSPYYANISAVNRAQLIDDALNLARAGYLSYDIALKITLYLPQETDYIPWDSAARALNYLNDVLVNGKNYVKYHKYVASSIKNFVLKANFEDTENGTHVDKLAKVLALNTACKYELEECENFVKKKLSEWLEKKDGSDLKPDLRRGILCGGLRIAEKNTWNETLYRYKESIKKEKRDRDEEADILAGLGCALKDEIPQKFLNLTLEKDSDIDIFAAMNSICAGNSKSFGILLNFINENIERIQKADKEDNSLLIALLNKLSNRIVTSEQYSELALLVHGKLQIEKVEGLTVAINNIGWIKMYQENVEKWVVDNCKACQAKTDAASSIALTSFVLIISLLLTRFY